jgi:anti-sigma regulatory factor (Ser/Thr protein kinase)
MKHAARPHWLQAFAVAGVRSSVPEARQKVAEAARVNGLGGRELFDLLVAVGEALSNAVCHGSPYSEFDEVTVRVGLLGEAVIVEVTDRGAGFGASRLCAPDALEDGGRGIPSMRALVDDLRFECHDGGTTVVLVKKIPT